MLDRQVLDHGYVRLVESWGSDQAIIEAARMSTDKGFLGWGPKRCVCRDGGELMSAIFPPDGSHCCKGTGEVPGDEKLLRFLWEHKHYSPFEFAGLTVEVQAPIFVFREWHRHRTQSYNEMSGRYTVLPDLFYVPSLERMMASRQSVVNKQGSGGQVTEPVARACIDALTKTYQEARQTYEELLRFSVAREVARLCLPVAQYSRMRASTDLRNWLGFLTLRMDPAAQWEIRQYANAVGEFVAQRFPRTWALWAA